MIPVFDEINYEPFYPRAMIVNGRCIVTRSAGLFPYVAQNRKTLYHNYYAFLRGLAISLGSLLRRGAERIPGDEQVGIIHSAWTAGYYHWITESLPRSLVLKDCFPSVSPILPSRAYAKYEESLRALGFKRILYFPNDRNLVASRPVITECPSFNGTVAPILLRRVRDEIYKNYELKPKLTEQVVYVSRAKARGRRVLNEEAVVKALAFRRAKLVHFEDLSFREQVSLMSRTSLLIGIHGAGLANMLFMPPGGRVIEILPERNGVFDYRKIGNSFRHQAIYMRLAEAAGLRYDYLLCKSDVPFYSRTATANVTVEIKALLEVIANKEQKKK